MKRKIEINRLINQLLYTERYTKIVKDRFYKEYIKIEPEKYKQIYIDDLKDISESIHHCLLELRENLYVINKIIDNINEINEIIDNINEINEIIDF